MEINYSSFCDFFCGNFCGIVALVKSIFSAGLLIDHTIIMFIIDDLFFVTLEFGSIHFWIRAIRIHLFVLCQMNELDLSTTRQILDLQVKPALD
jgi:hypothetical protein